MEALSLGGVKSLFQCAVLKVVNSLSCHLDKIQDLPVNIKDRILHLLMKRGGITDDNISKLVHPGMKLVDLSECFKIGDQSLFIVAKVCKNLQKLDLTCTKGDRSSVTAEGVIRVAHGCHHLQIVYLRRCVSITDDAIVKLSENCRYLRDLDIGGCQLITDKALHAIGQNTTVLRSLNISHSQVTDEGILSLVTGKSGQTLTELHVNQCTQLTDEAVEAVVQFCPCMDIFIFSGCPKMTDQSRVMLEEVLGIRPMMKQLTEEQARNTQGRDADVQIQSIKSVSS